MATGLKDVRQLFAGHSISPMTPGQFARFIRGAGVTEIATVLNAIQRKVALDIYTLILTQWPVDTGWSRSAWQVSVDGPGDVIPPKPRVKSGTGTGRPRPATGREILSALGDMKLGPTEIHTTIWLSNPLPYAEVIEFGLYPGRGERTVRGFSKQAPKGAVRIAIKNVLGKDALKR